MGLLIDLIPNSPNCHYYNCMKDSEEEILEVKGLMKDDGKKIIRCNMQQALLM